MGFVTCCSRPKQKQIHILYTDALDVKPPVHLTVYTNSNSSSTADLTKHLETYDSNGDIIATPFDGSEQEFEDIFHEIHDDNINIQHEPPGKGKRYTIKEWMIFISVCIGIMINISVAHAFGTLFPHILEEFEESRASTAAIHSVLIGVGLCSGFFVGSIVQQFGPSRCGVVGNVLFSFGFVASFFSSSTAFLVVTCGVISGSGFALLVISTNYTASLCFDGTARVIGLSVVSTAIGVGSMVYPYLLSWMVDMFGLRGTLLLLGGITMNGIPIALLWKHAEMGDKPEIKKTSDEVNDNHPVMQLLARVSETIQHKPFCTALFGYGLALPSITMFEILALDILESNGSERNLSVMLFIVLNAASIPGRLVPGLIKRIRGCASLTGPMLGALISAIAMGLLNLTNTLEGSGVVCAALGVSKGILLSSVQIIVIEMLDTVKFSIGLGLVFGLVGVCTTVLGPLNGLLRDVSGSYTASLYIASVSMCIALLLFCLAMFLSAKSKAKEHSAKIITVYTVTHL